MRMIGAVASVGMLAKDAERFRRGEDGDEGSSGAPEPSSQRKLFRIPFYAAWFTIRSGLIGATHSPMRHKTEALSEPFEIAEQLVVGPVSPRLASRRIHLGEDGLL